jgi:cystathionine gamma-synthase
LSSLGLTEVRRFFIHKAIQRFADAIVEKYGKVGESAVLFPSMAVAARCVVFLSQQVPQLTWQKVRIIELVSIDQQTYSSDMKFVLPKISAVLFPSEHFTIAKTFWQHSGDGISSRRAAYCHQLFKEGLLIEKAEAENATMFCKGPRRYRSRFASANSSPTIQPVSDPSAKVAEEVPDPDQFVEERFGRNLDLSRAAKAKLAIRRRIAGSLTANVDLKDALELEKDTATLRQAPGFSEDDVYLFPTGMSSIFNTHQAMLASRGELKSICYGLVDFEPKHVQKCGKVNNYRFPYIDTLKILQKFGPGCLFYGHGSKEDLDDLETRLARGERFLAFFCEFPGNPLLKSPDLLRVRQLADRYDFGVIVDETIGNFLNVHVLPYADVVVSSLTKVFSGDSNVMGGR